MVTLHYFEFEAYMYALYPDSCVKQDINLFFLAITDTNYSFLIYGTKLNIGKFMKFFFHFLLSSSILNCLLFKGNSGVFQVMSISSHLTFVQSCSPESIIRYSCLVLNKDNVYNINFLFEYFDMAYILCCFL